ncbi:glycoside hydrolase domain-containing protein [Planctomycetota bacterium]
MCQIAETDINILNCLLKCVNSDLKGKILAAARIAGKTVYVKNEKTLISLASWAPEKVDCQLNISWDTLGLNPQKALLTAPFIEDFQNTAAFSPTDSISVEPGKGWLLILSQNESQ